MPMKICRICSSPIEPDEANHCDVCAESLWEENDELRKAVAELLLPLMSTVLTAMPEQEKNTKRIVL